MADYVGKVTAWNGHPIYEGRPAGAIEDPVGTAGDAVFNAGYDLIDTFDGLGTMGSAFTGRAYEMLPFVPGGLQPPIRPGDMNTLGQMGQAILGNYQHSYVDPIMEGRPLDLGKHFIAHPVNTLMDISGVGSLLKAPKLLGNAAKQVAKNAVVEQAMNKAQALATQGTQAVGDVAEGLAAPGSVGEQVLNTVEQVAPITPAGKKAADLTKGFTQAVQADDAQFMNDLGKLWRKIPAAVRPNVKAYAEGWHPDLMAGQAVPQEVANYLAKAEEYSKVMRDRIGGFVDQTALELDKYQPAALKLNNMTGQEYAALTLEQQQELLRQTATALTGKNINPQYSPHVNPNEVKGVLQNVGTIKGGLTQKDLIKQGKLTRQISELQKELLKLEEQAKAGGTAKDMFDLAEKIKKVEETLKRKATEKAGFLKTKQTEGLKAVESHYDALRTRWIQISQFQNAYEKILKAAIQHAEDLDLLNNAPDPAAAQMAEDAAKAMADAGNVAINGHDLAKQVLGGLKGAVLSEQELDILAKRIMPEKIMLPPELKRALDIAMKVDQRYGRNPFVEAYDELVRISKRYMLGGNLTYGLAQGVQSVFMLELVAMNGPKSAISSLASYYLALNKTVRAEVPLTIADDVLGATIASKHYIGDALEFTFNKVIAKAPDKIQPHLKGMLHAYDKYADMVLKSGQIADSFVRAKAGIHHALMIAQENTPFGQAVREMLDTTKSAELVGKVYLDPAAEMQIAKQVNNALGNFQAISQQAGMKLVGRITPFPTWFAHISGYVAKLPKNHPYKTILMNNLAQLQSEYVADPNVPQHLKGAVSLEGVGPNGLPTVASKETMNPITSVADLAEPIRFIATGQGDKSLQQLLTGPLQLGMILLLTRENPLTGKPFDDPNLPHDKHNRQYSESDAWRMIEDPSFNADEQRPLPNDLVLRTFVPVLTRQMETFLEKLISDGQRSQMTGLFYSAPKRDQEGRIKQSADWITLFLQQLVNFTPIEYDPNAQFRAAKSKQQQVKELYNDLMKKQAQ